jgi:dihydrofolate reductase
MSQVIATITTSVDGYYAGPNDGPGSGLGLGGERLHYWVMGGPWTYETEHEPNVGMAEADRDYFADLTSGIGAGIIGRGMYDAADAWGGTNPFDGPVWIVTHRLEDAPDPATGFRFIDSLDGALKEANAAAAGKDVAISGGGDVIRQALADGLVDVLALSTAPLVLGGGKRLFDGFDHDIDLEIREVYTGPYATHTIYEVVRHGANG